MKITTEAIKLTSDQVLQLQEINNLVIESANNDSKGIVLAQLNPNSEGNFPDSMIVSFFPHEAANAIVSFCNMLAKVVGHYDKLEVDKNGK